MKYRRLGRSDIEVSVVCHGCWSIVSGDANWGPQNVEDSIAGIRASLDAGVNFFDTAEVYGGGESEEILARALDERRKEVIIASKVGTKTGIPAGERAAERIRASCEASLRRLGSDYIDLYQIHWPSPGLNMAEATGALEELKAAGKIRAAGVSNFGASYLADLPPDGPLESNQLCYSLLWRAIEHAVQPRCVEKHLSILCYSPLCQGLLTGKFAGANDVPPERARMRLFSSGRPHTRHGEDGCEAKTFEAIAAIGRICNSAGVTMGEASLGWLLRRDGVVSAIAGARNARQARQNAGAGEVELSDDVIEALTAATEPVKARVGVNADFWQSESRMEKPS
jgi:aryl-alcohol dehydrogenase-like predicted oxidoreductase